MTSARSASTCPTSSACLKMTASPSSQPPGGDCWKRPPRISGRRRRCTGQGRAGPLTTHVTDSYFVVAHFHYVLFGTIVFATYAGIYFWFPKMTGRMMDETLGKVHFWLTFIGFHLTFLVQHWLGAEGMPRRYVDYLPTDGFTTLNTISSIGAFVLGISTLPFLWNVFKSYRYGRVVTVDDPWGFGNSLEWATSCP